MANADLAQLLIITRRYPVGGTVYYDFLPDAFTTPNLFNSSHFAANPAIAEFQTLGVGVS